MIMKRVASALLATFVLVGAAGQASAACTVEGWVDGTNQRPIWKCTDPNE
jgi:hypothetical protein